MKFKNIRVKNFQSLKDLSVDFNEKGIFRFTGYNNSGKSAFLKAISTLMRNASNNTYKRFLRDEETTFEITSEDFDGNTVTLSRGAIDFYEWTIDGKQGRMDKTQGKVPLEVQEYFNLYEENEKTKECLNIRLPREVLLYVDTSGGDNAMMLQKALGTEEYMLAIKKVDKKGREINKEIKLVEKYLDKEVEKLDTVKQDLITKEYNLEEIERYEGTLRKDYEELQKVSSLVESTVEYAKTDKELKEKKNVLEGLEIENIQKDIKELKKISDVVKKKEEEEELERKLNEKRDVFDGLDVDGIKESIEVSKKISEVIEMAKSKVRSEKIIQQRKSKLEIVEKEIEDFREELGVCPLCKTELTEGHEH